VLDESLRLEEPALALLAVLLLRGPQTVGELRTRTERMTAFENLSAVNDQLELMAVRADPLVLRLARRPGQKEERWTQLLMDAPGSTAADGAGGPGAGTIVYSSSESLARPGPSPDLSAPTGPDDGSLGQDPSGARVEVAADLAGEVASLREEVAMLRAAVAELQERLSS
jgi:uncharacterized protein YceH (UPF0502 family)